ncbi:MAG TPA: hypothetical protein VGF55_00510 [Gemmataceae bacterium]|jgi:hypothetical protein
MRVGVWVAAAVGLAAAAAPARAQTPFATVLGGPPPSAIQQVPIDMSNVVVAPSLPDRQSRFNFSAILRRLTPSGFPTLTGVSPLPAPGTFPSTKYPSAKMVGAPPYQLGDPRAAKFPFQPVMPILNATATGN